MKSTLIRIVGMLFLGAACGGDGTPATADAGIDATALTTIRVTLEGFPTDASAANLKYAYQDNGGAWKEAPAPVAGVLTLALEGPRYAVAEYCRTIGDFDTRDVALSYRSLSDGLTWTASVDQACRPAPKFAGVLSGSIQTTAQARHSINFGGRRISVATAAGSTTATYALAIPPSTGPLFARRSKAADGQLDSMILDRAFTAGLSTVKNLDFNVGGFAPERIPVAPGTTSATVSYYLGRVFAGGYADGSNPTDFPVLPLDKRLAGDTYLFEQGFTASAANADVVYGKIVAVPAPITNPAIPTIALEARAEANGHSIVLPTTLAADTSLSIFELSDCADRTLCTVAYRVNDPQNNNGLGMRWSPPNLADLPGWSGTVLQAASNQGWFESWHAIGKGPDVGYESTFISYKFGVPPALAESTAARRLMLRDQAARARRSFVE